MEPPSKKLQARNLLITMMLMSAMGPEGYASADDLEAVWDALLPEDKRTQAQNKLIKEMDWHDADS